MSVERVALLLCEDHHKWAHFPGRCEDLLGGATVDVWCCFEGEFPDPDDYDAFLVSGSHYSVADDLPWMRRLAAWLRAFPRDAASGKRLVAICFGCQILAHAMGGVIAAASCGFRFGTETVTFAASGLPLNLDPILSSQRVTFPTSHGDHVVSLGSEGDPVIVASSEVTDIEAFFLPDTMLAIQGHPELTASDLLDVIAPSLVSKGTLDEAKVAAAQEALRTADPSPVAAAIRKFLRVDAPDDGQSSPVPDAANFLGLVHLSSTALTLLSYASYLVHLAFVGTLFGAGVDIVGMGAAMSAMVLVYMADRMVVQEEDRYADHAHIRHARGSNRYFFLAAFFALYAACAAARPKVLYHTASAAAVCVWYAVPIPGVGRRIKNLFPGSKNLFVGGVHTYWALACLDVWPPIDQWTPVLLLVCLTFNASMSTMFMDVKDVDGDRRAGVVTLPTLLGPWDALYAGAVAYHVAEAVCCMSALFAPRAAPFVTLAINYRFHGTAMSHLARQQIVPTIDFVCLSWSLPMLVHQVTTLCFS